MLNFTGGGVVVLGMSVGEGLWCWRWPKGEGCGVEDDGRVGVVVLKMTAG